MRPSTPFGNRPAATHHPTLPVRLPTPASPCLACSGAAVFFYLHMDCLDGKQARRTKNSSPLGQLFDHGGCWGGGWFWGHEKG